MKFVTDYAATGLRNSIPPVGAGFLTDGALQAEGVLNREMVQSLGAISV